MIVQRDHAEMVEDVLIKWIHINVFVKLDMAEWTVKQVSLSCFSTSEWKYLNESYMQLIFVPRVVESPCDGSCMQLSHFIFILFGNILVFFSCETPLRQ
jgi:hypothetical protein